MGPPTPTPTRLHTHRPAGVDHVRVEPPEGGHNDLFDAGHGPVRERQARVRLVEVRLELVEPHLVPLLEGAVVGALLLHRGTRRWWWWWGGGGGGAEGRSQERLQQRLLAVGERCRAGGCKAVWRRGGLNGGFKSGYGRLESGCSAVLTVAKWMKARGPYLTLVSGMPMAAGCEGNLLPEVAGCGLFLCQRLRDMSVVVRLGFN